MTCNGTDPDKKKNNSDPFLDEGKGSITNRLIQLAESRTIRETAKLWGVSTATVSLYTKKGGMPSLDRALAIANAEGVKLEWLAYGEDTPINDDTVNVDDLVPITKYDVAASAGGGTFIETEESTIATISSAWLNNHNLPKKGLCIISAKGNSMKPSIQNGDELFLKLIEDCPDKPFDGVFAINLDQALKVKRLEYSFTMDGYRVISDNKEYTEEFIHRSEIDHRLRVIGEVVLVLGKPATPAVNTQQ